MSAIHNVVRQLKERRLWPVAILLVAGLVAVPVVLAKQPEAPAPAPPATADNGADDVLASQPIVAEAAPSDRAKRRLVLGTPKNPFAVDKPQTGSEEPPSSDKSNKADDQTPAPSNNGDTSTPATGGTSTPSTGTPLPSTPPAPHKVYGPGALSVRITAGDAPMRKKVEKLQPLPDADSPVLIYLGLTKDGKKAVFLVDEGVEAVGDGSCYPAPDKCETVKLRAGQTEFLDVKDENGNTTAQYQVDLLKIHNASASAARANSGESTRVKTSRLLRSAAAGTSVEGATGLRAVTGL